jgi:hypothetical protein
MHFIDFITSSQTTLHQKRREVGGIECNIQTEILAQKEVKECFLFLKFIKS